MNVNNSIVDDQSVQLYYGKYFKFNSKLKYINPPGILYRYYLFNYSLCHQAWFLSSDSIKRAGGFSTDSNIGGDYILLLDLILLQKISYKKLNIFVIKYKGGGISTNSKFIMESETFRNKMRKKAFSKLEYFLYPKIFFIRTFIKTITWDVGLYKLFAN
jgi:hypothetical protein